MRVPVIAVLLVLAACSDTPTAPKVHEISTLGEQFLPNIEIVARGEVVRWTFTVNPTDNLGHNVLFKPRVAGAPDDIPLEQRSGTVTRTFNTTGTFNYVCDLHGGMTGQIIVQ
jgi:plastocyanin